MISRALTTIFLASYLAGQLALAPHAPGDCEHDFGPHLHICQFVVDHHAHDHHHDSAELTKVPHRDHDDHCCIELPDSLQAATCPHALAPPDDVSAVAFVGPIDDRDCFALASAALATSPPQPPGCNLCVMLRTLRI